MPTPKFCDLTPSDAAAQVKRMLGHVPSQQAAHTFWSNLTTLGQIQQNQRLEIDPQGVFRLESTSSRKLNTLSPFRSASRSITELHPLVLAVLYRAQIESSFPTPQLSKELGSRLAITENQPYNRYSNRRSSISQSVGFIAREGVVATPVEFNEYGWLTDVKFIADKVITQVAQARAGLTNMLAGYRSQWFNSKKAQAECVNDLVRHAERQLMVFDAGKNGSIAQCLAFKISSLPGGQLEGLMNLDREKIIAIEYYNDIIRTINNFVSNTTIVSSEDRNDYSKQASMLLWGHHVLRDSWVYRDLDFDLFDDDINDLEPSLRVLEEAVGVNECNVKALGQLGGYLRRHLIKIQNIRSAG